MATDTDEELSRAIVLYLGFGQLRAPMADPNRVIEAFGPARGDDLVESVKSLIGEVMASPVDWSVETLASATVRIRGEIHERHPDLSDEAVKALGWEFGWTWR